MADPRRVPIKGKPDFTNFSDERLETCMETVQGLIHAYGAFGAERELLSGIWKAMLDHRMDRGVYEGKSTGAEARTIPPKVSPAGRKARLFIR